MDKTLCTIYQRITRKPRKQNDWDNNTAKMHARGRLKSRVMCACRCHLWWVDHGWARRSPAL